MRASLAPGRAVCFGWRVEVALFIPCYVDQLSPRVGMATVELLERLGVKVHYPEAQTCCGQPMANMGAPDAALERRFCEIFAPYEAVVSPSGSCVAMVRNHYTNANPVRQRTYELTEFLTDVLKAEIKGRYPHRVGLHKSCHGLRDLRLGSGSERRVPAFDKGRSLLEKLDGITLVDLQRPDECCGFGGTFAVAEEAISCSMGKDRISDHERAGAEVIVAGDQSCLLHLQGLLTRQKKPLRTLHIAELLAEATAPGAEAGAPR